MAEPTTVALRRRYWWRRLCVVLPIVALLGVTGTEVFLRERYGLGSPVLMMSDRVTEYRAVPNQHMVRLGNHVDYNSYSMRSIDFPKVKIDSRERRVLMIGDSVINGGNQTDQSQIATSLLQRRLNRKLGVPVIVGNISAGSWGPENELGYLQKFGTFDADQIVIVISDHDATDEIGTLPTEERVTSRTYWFAIGEAFDRLFPSIRGLSTASDPLPTIGQQAPCLGAFEEMLRLAQSATAKPAIVAFHPEREQVDSPIDSPGHKKLREICARYGIEPIELRNEYRRAFDAGQDPYRDSIHPNAFGQKAMADAIAPALEAALLGNTTQPSTRENR